MRLRVSRLMRLLRRLVSRGWPLTAAGSRLGRSLSRRGLLLSGCRGCRRKINRRRHRRRVVLLMMLGLCRMLRVLVLLLRMLAMLSMRLMSLMRLVLSMLRLLLMVLLAMLRMRLRGGVLAWRSITSELVPPRHIRLI